MLTQQRKIIPGVLKQKFSSLIAESLSTGIACRTSGAPATSRRALKCTRVHQNTGTKVRIHNNIYVPHRKETRQHLTIYTYFDSTIISSFPSRPLLPLIRPDSRPYSQETDLARTLERLRAILRSLIAFVSPLSPVYRASKIFHHFLPRDLASNCPCNCHGSQQPSKQRGIRHTGYGAGSWRRRGCSRCLLRHSKLCRDCRSHKHRSGPRVNLIAGTASLVCTSIPPSPDPAKMKTLSPELARIRN